MMTKQEIYDKVCAHLAQQKKRAMKDGACVYRGVNNTQCAFGCLIPDALYDPIMDVQDGDEAPTAEWVMGHFPEVAKLIGQENSLLVGALQKAHDNFSRAASLREQLREIAGQYEIAPGAEQAITEWS